MHVAQPKRHHNHKEINNIRCRDGMPKSMQTRLVGYKVEVN